ncbi:MAG: hypothetical protein J6A04_02235 [Clostridia bacterium]|nr:hypothetical protein [Clostridia bacterium]
MKKKEKRMIAIIVIVGIIIVGGLLIWRNATNKSEPKQGENQVTEKYVDVLEDGTKLNKSNKLKEIKKVDGLEIGNIQLTYQNGMAVILGDVKNTTSNDIGLTVIELTLYDEKNNVIDKIEGFVSPVKAGETVQLNMGVSADYANAYDFKVVKK